MALRRKCTGAKSSAEAVDKDDSDIEIVVGERCISVEKDDSDIEIVVGERCISVETGL